MRVKKLFLIYNITMFSFLEKSKKSERIHLVCLITGYAISGAVVKIFTKQGSVNRPVVLYSTEVPIRIPQLAEISSTTDDIQQALKQVITDCKRVVPHYDELHCVVGEPWIISTTRTAHLEKREGFLINKKVVSELLSRETKLFEQEMIKEYATGEEYGLLEMSMPIVDLNGYRVDAHHYEQNKGITARTLDVHCTYTIAPVEIIEQIVEVCVDAFHRTDIIFHSFDHAKRILLENYEYGVICELGGETIPCMIISRKIPTHFSVIPTGLHTFENMLMNAFGISQSKIPSIFSFTGDENILMGNRDVYHTRILDAYEEFAQVIPFHVAEIKKYIQEFREPVVVIGRPEWLGHLKKLLERDLYKSVIIPSQDTLSDSLVITQTANSVTVPLTLAIIHSLHHETK